MSNDTDDRMDRATRIRQMREGQREDHGDGDASSDGDAPGGGDAPGDAAPTDPGDAGDEPRSTESTDSSATDGAEPAGPDDAPDATGPGDVPDDGTDEQTDDRSGEEAAMAAARRAAQAAAETTGTVSTPAPDDGVAGGEGTTATPEGGAPDAGAPVAGTPDVASAATESDQGATTGVPAAAMQGPTGVELPDEESVQAAIADEVVDSEPDDGTVTGRAADAEEAATAEDSVRVLEFTLGDEHYCLDITHVEEIVKRDAITRVPNTPDYVEGVVDLRGQITTILNPKLLLDIDQGGSESLLVVFDPEGFEDQGAIGWVVDEVRQVVPVAESEVSDPPVDADYIEGVVDRDDEEFVIWTNPEVAIRLATAAGDGESN